MSRALIEAVRDGVKKIHLATFDSTVNTRIHAEIGDVLNTLSHAANAAEEQSRHAEPNEKRSVTLTVGQCLDAAQSCGGLDDLEMEITIEKMEAWECRETKEKMPAGLYAHLTEYPEEGLFGPLSKVQPHSDTSNERLRKAAEELLAHFKEVTGPDGLRKASFTQYVIQSLDKWDALTTALQLNRTSRSQESITTSTDAAELLDKIDALGDDSMSLRVHGLSDHKHRLREVRMLVSQLRAALSTPPQKEGQGVTLSECLDALWFYGNPETYHACVFYFDPPTGGFDGDFDKEHGHPHYDRSMPGKLARAILSRADKPLSESEVSK
jgi:hypothetical protein